MPKAKPTQVIVHRIELQESEREMLELAVAGNVATNAVSAAGAVFTGIGSMLAPFAPAFGALAALWIGDRTLDAVREDGERRKQEIEAGYSEIAGIHIQGLATVLNQWYADGGWDAICGDPNAIGPSLEFNSNVLDWIIENNMDKGPYPNWLVDEFVRFLRTICASPNAKSSSRTPAEYWASEPDPWMTVEKYGAAAYYADTGGSRWDAFWKGIGTL